MTSPGTPELAVQAFIDPNVQIHLTQQLETMQEFWAKLGYSMVELGGVDTDLVCDAALANPTLRLVPAPLLDLAGRTQVVEAAKQFRGNCLSNSEEGLWIPNTGTVYGELLRDPTDMMRSKYFTYPLVYNGPDGVPVIGRQAWIETMVDHGKLVQDEEGRHWTVSLLDVAVDAARHPDKSPGELFAATHATITPETVLTVHLLHQANGTPNTELAVNFANEAVGQVNVDGAIEDIVEVSGVRWYAPVGRVRLGHWVGSYYPDKTFGTLESVPVL